VCEPDAKPDYATEDFFICMSKTSGVGLASPKETLTLSWTKEPSLQDQSCWDDWPDRRRIGWMQDKRQLSWLIRPDDVWDGIGLLCE
jgi:hypothetical protein